MAVNVIQPGVFTTVQDLGRPGHRHEGVPVSGAADEVALRVANLLVGNEESAAGLECTLHGPEVIFDEDRVVAVGGGAFDGLPWMQPFLVRAGERVRFGRVLGGCRGVIAIAGGIAVARVLGSRSTCTRAGFGGFEGRALRSGDALPIGAGATGLPSGYWHIDVRILPAYANTVTVRVLAGAHSAAFPAGWADAEYEVLPASDRMGVRLGGPAVRRSGGEEAASAPVAPGTVQVPPDGQPLVLLADAQTIGGYPRLAHVITVDLPLMAQLPPGGRVRFALTTLAEAHRLWLAREHALGLLRLGLTALYRDVARAPAG